MKTRFGLFVYVLFSLLGVGDLARFRRVNLVRNHNIRLRNSTSVLSKGASLVRDKTDSKKQNNFTSFRFENKEIFYRNDTVVNKTKVVNEIPGINSRKLKEKMYNLLGKIKTHPEAAIYTLITGVVPKEHAVKYSKGTKKGNIPENDDKGSISETLKQLLRRFYTSSSKSKTRRKSSGHRDISTSSLESLQPAKAPEEEEEEEGATDDPMAHSRVKRKSKGVMYLPINHPQADPCAPPKGSKLMEALPLVFLSTILSVADAVGNVVNNINSNNNNNNNNNDNNINNDNTNLGANINNANQINVVPFGGRALRIARAVMNSIGRMAMGVYEAVVPWDTKGERVDTGEVAADAGEVRADPGKNNADIGMAFGDTSGPIDQIPGKNYNFTVSNTEVALAKRHSIVKRQDNEVFEHQGLYSSSKLTDGVERLSPVVNISKSKCGTQMDFTRKGKFLNDNNISLLFEDHVINHMLQLYSGKDQKPLDFHWINCELTKAERIFRSYLKRLKENSPSMNN